MVRRPLESTHLMGVAVVLAYGAEGIVAIPLVDAEVSAPGAKSVSIPRHGTDATCVTS